MTQITLASGPRLREDDPTAKGQERRRFRGALFFSGLGHALLIALLFFWQPANEEAVPLPPIPVTVVKLGQSGASGGGSGDSAASAPSASSETATAAPSTPPSTTEPQPQATATPEPQAPTPPETQPQPPTEIPSLAQSTVAPAPAPQEAPQPVPPHKPAPPRPKPPTPTVATVPPSPPTVAQAQPTPQQQAAQAPATGSQTASAAANSDAQGVGGRGRGNEGPGLAAVGNGARNGPGDDYLDAVRRWVNGFRKYPDEAVKQKQEGTVGLGFKFARDGTVLDAWIEKSSGYPLLDQAALAMIRAASPIPKVPDQYKGDTLTLVMPENFRIGLFDRLFR